MLYSHVDKNVRFHQGLVEGHLNATVKNNVSLLQVMCVQYWPASKELEETYGGITIGIIQEEELANFHIRTFRLCKKELDVSLSLVLISRFV